MSATDKHKSDRKAGQEMYLIDRDGKKQDASIHEDILAQGKEDSAAFGASLDQLDLAAKSKK